MDIAKTRSIESFVEHGEKKISARMSELVGSENMRVFVVEIDNQKIECSKEDFVKLLGVMKSLEDEFYQ